MLVGTDDTTSKLLTNWNWKKQKSSLCQWKELFLIGILHAGPLRCALQFSIWYAWQHLLVCGCVQKIQILPVHMNSSLHYGWNHFRTWCIVPKNSRVCLKTYGCKSFLTTESTFLPFLLQTVCEQGQVTNIEGLSCEGLFCSAWKRLVARASSLFRFSQHLV
jgi:hypothetical protein